MPSFDVVSELEHPRSRERRGPGEPRAAARVSTSRAPSAVFELEELTVTMKAEAEFQLKQMLDILRVRLSKRGIDPMCVDAKDPSANLASATQEVTLKHGIDQDSGSKLSKADQGIEAEGAGGDSGRQGARHRQVSATTCRKRWR